MYILYYLTSFIGAAQYARQRKRKKTTKAKKECTTY